MGPGGRRWCNVTPTRWFPWAQPAPGPAPDAPKAAFEMPPAPASPVEDVWPLAVERTAASEGSPTSRSVAASLSGRCATIG
eukprot:1037141-Lingulodinium_polyedra.AAC.1